MKEQLNAYERWLCQRLILNEDPEAAKIVYNQIAMDLIGSNLQTFDLLEKANPTSNNISPEAITNAVHYLYNNTL